jgi:hypothetical protein
VALNGAPGDVAEAVPYSDGNTVAQRAAKPKLERDVQRVGHISKSAAERAAAMGHYHIEAAIWRILKRPADGEALHGRVKCYRLVVRACRGLGCIFWALTGEQAAKHGPRLADMDVRCKTEAHDTAYGKLEGAGWDLGVRGDVNEKTVTCPDGVCSWHFNIEDGRLVREYSAVPASICKPEPPVSIDMHRWLGLGSLQRKR